MAVIVFAAALGALLATPPTTALAACTPAAGAGTPAAGTTVTCSGTTTDQNAPAGYGDASQTGLTINVQPGASVTGTAGDGLLLNDLNTVNNSGTLDGQAGSGINAGPNLTVTNTASGIIRGTDNGIIAPSAAVTNYGLITVTGAFGVGIDVVTGTVNNLGIISANVSNGKGIIAISDLTLNNSGTITATGTNGFAVQLLTTGTVNNNAGGTITGRDYGVLSQDTATVNNAGVITATGNSGIGVYIQNDGTVVNNGTISAMGGNGNGVVFNDKGSLVNTGTIQGGVYGVVAGRGSVVNSGSISGGAIGVIFGGFGATSLVNSGTITGTLAAIDASFTTGATLTFLPGSRIVGDILLGLNNIVYVHTGGGIGMQLTFGACGCGGITDTGSTVIFVGGGYGVVSGNTIATLDPTAFALADRTVLDFANAISAMLNGRLNSGGFGGTTSYAGSSSVATAANDAFAHVPGLASANEGHLANAASYDRASGIGVWTRGFAGARNQGADGAIQPADTRSYGGMIGLDKAFAADLRLGAFVGAGQSRLAVGSNTQKVDADYVFGGVYGRKTLGRNSWGIPFLDVTFTAGHSSNSSDRTLASSLAPTGFETATGKYDGWFASPEIAYGVVVPLGGGYTLTPAARLRYLASHFGGYSETGATQTLAVESRTAHNLEQRAEVAVAYQNATYRTSLTGGLLAAERLGDATVSTVLIGQNLSFATPGRDTVVGVYSALGIDVRLNASTSLYGAAQGTMMTDNSRTGVVQGGVRVAF